MSESLGDGNEVEVQLKSMQEMFRKNLMELLERKGNNTKVFSKDKYCRLIGEVKEAKTKEKKVPLDYRRLNRFDVIVVGGNEKLIVPVIGGGVKIQYYLHKEELFDILHDTHISIGHGGRTRMEKELQLKYKNVTKEVIMLYLTLCKPFQQKNSMPKKSLVSKPMVFKELNSRCQVEIIEMQSNPNGEYKFIMNYQDHLTKFIFLRPLKSKRAEEVAHALLDIFTIISASSVLQSDKGREFSNHIVNELSEMWPELKIVDGKPRHSQSQGSVERANQDVQNMMITWMQSNNSPHWAESLRFTQRMKNRAYHQGIQQTPYEAMFGSKAKVGLSTSNLPKEVITNLKTEEDLERAESEIQNSLKTQSEKQKNLNDAVSSNMEDQFNEVEITPKIGTQIMPQDNKNIFYCVVCEKECTGAHSCVLCNRYVHAICGVSSGGEIEGYGSKVTCTLCDKKKTIKKKRIVAHTSLHTQASKMLKRSDSKFPPAKVGDCVKVQVPDVDRGRGDPRSILAVIMTVNDKLGTEHGVLKQLYARTEFTIFTKKTMDYGLCL